MTRINLVHPSKLADQHLFAEWREIKHIPAFLNQLLAKGRTTAEIKANISERFTLNKGHKYFFVDKMRFINDRYSLLYYELIHRKYEVAYDIEKWWDSIKDFPREFVNDYKPDELAMFSSNERIIERISQRPDWYRYKGEIKDVKFFTDLLYS